MPKEKCYEHVIVTPIGSKASEMTTLITSEKCQLLMWAYVDFLAQGRFPTLFYTLLVLLI